jgi:hypothetical protein
MATTPAVNIASLTRAAIQYNDVLRELPFYQLNSVCQNLRINILQVDGEDRLISIRRKGGILRPYVAGLPLGKEQELMKFYESTLKPERTYAEIVDNITNYTDKKIISNQGEMVDNKTKKHPLELTILSNIVKSYSEDVTFALFFAERDTTVMSPMTAFTGFFPKLDILVTAGEISSAKGNLKTTGAFVDPTTVVSPTETTDAAAYKQLVDFVKSANPLLRNTGEVLLYASENPIECARKSLWKMTKSFQYPTVDQLMAQLRSDAKVPGLQLVYDVTLGSGDKLMMMKPGLLDLGVSNQSDDSFVQVRNPYADPNEVQFWIQASYDTRIKDVHPKLFQTNEQVNTGVIYSGDY